MTSTLLLLALAATLVFLTLAHELGHFVAARRLGIPVKRLTVGLGPILWRTRLSGDMELVLRAIPAGMAVGVPARRSDDGRLLRPVKHDMIIAAGGPAASFILAGLLLGAMWLLQGQPALQLWLAGAATLSALLAGLNLIPIPGLDGGHLMVLVAARLGKELTPRQESALHRAGVRVTLAGCVGVLVISQAVRLLS
jgi:regulator of sigma E protease